MVTQVVEDSHTSIGDENFRIFQSFWEVDADLFVKNETLVKIRVRQLPADFFDDLNMVKVRRSLSTFQLSS